MDVSRAKWGTSRIGNCVGRTLNPFKSLEQVERRVEQKNAGTFRAGRLAAALFLLGFAGGVARIALGLLLGFQGFHGGDALGMFAFGLRLGFDLGLLAAFFFFLAALFGLDGGKALFLGASGGALLARGGDLLAFLGLGFEIDLGGFGPELGFGQHLGARLGGRIHAIVELGLFKAGHT